MDNHERSTLEHIANLLHGLLGRDDAKADYRPELTFVPDNPDGVLVFPDSRAGKEKSPSADAVGAEEGIVRFTKKEILKMPKKFREQFKLNGYWVTIRQRIRGKTSCNYELRYRRNGYNISVLLI